MSGAGIPIRFILNDQPRQAEVLPQALLIDLVREGFGLKGTKRSCDMEICGACTMMLDGRLVSSCTTLAVEADGRQVTTVEGLTPAEGLSQVQEALVLHGAIQCGFCTPGFVVAITQLLQSNPTPLEEDVQRHLRGNLCRCTGYVKIMAAVRSLVEAKRSAEGLS